jgi:hypothetical protein
VRCINLRQFDVGIAMMNLASILYFSAMEIDRTIFLLQRLRLTSLSAGDQPGYILDGDPAEVAKFPKIRSSAG